MSARLAFGAAAGRAISQAELGEMIGVGQKTVATWEQGRKRPSIDTYAVLARALNVDPGWLIYGLERTPDKAVVQEPAKQPPIAHPLQKETKVFKKETYKPLRHPDQSKGRKQG